MIPAHVLQWALLGLALWLAALAAVLAVMAAARRSDEQSSGEATPASSGPAPAPVPRTASELVTAACVALRADYGALLGPQRGDQEAGLLTEHGNARTPAAMANAVTLARTALSVNAPVVAHDDVAEPAVVAVALPVTSNTGHRAALVLSGLRGRPMLGLHDRRRLHALIAGGFRMPRFARPSPAAPERPRARSL